MSLRICPSCSAEYDEDVERCVADGTLTVALEPTVVRPSGGFPPLPTAPPAPSLTASNPFGDLGTEKTAQSSGATAVIDPLVGTTVGEYVIQGALGEGGMGVVYEGRHPLIGKRVAIKCLKREIAANPDEAARLLAEARAANSIGHRGIIDIFGFGTLPDGRQYFAMEYLQGESLAERIARGPLSTDEALGLMEEILGPLSAAHAAGVIHRDLKPSNIFLVAQPDGVPFVKLLDFGLAKQAPVSKGATPQTNVARILGTPEFMAPEQARGEPVSPRTDLYAFGVIAYELVVGRAPFAAPSPWAVIGMHVSAPPPRASDGNPEIPSALDDLIHRLMAKVPGDRPEDAETVRAEIRAVRRSLKRAETAMDVPAPGSFGPPRGTASARPVSRAGSRSASSSGPRRPATGATSRGAVATEVAPAAAALGRGTPARGSASMGSTRRGAPATPSVAQAPEPAAQVPRDMDPAQSPRHAPTAVNAALDLPGPSSGARPLFIVGGLLLLAVVGTVALLALKQGASGAAADDAPVAVSPLVAEQPLQPPALPEVPPRVVEEGLDAGPTPPAPASGPGPDSQAVGAPDASVQAIPPRPTPPPRSVGATASVDALRRRLARVEAAWKRVRATKTEVDRTVFDGMLGFLKKDAAAAQPDRVVLKRGLDDFVEQALGGKEP